MDNNNKTTKFLPQGHAPVVKKENNYSYTLFRTLPGIKRFDASSLSVL
ncbi:Uncharacterised protein [Porphyromonas cangingivalis]|nr:Uncharacterised protein [Porphyromonas cangingivalis]